MFGQFSLGTFGMIVGSILTAIGFYAYFFSDNATLNLVGFFYGIPLLLGGFALKSAELKPIPLSTDPTTSALREQQATQTQNQIRKDVTRYRYGQEAHLDSSLSHLGLSPSDNDRPVLTQLREEDHSGSYALVLEFDSPHIPFATWENKREKMERFFGPGLRVELKQPQENWVEVALISTPEEKASTSQI